MQANSVWNQSTTIINNFKKSKIMNKQGLIEAIAAKAQVSKAEAAKVIDAALEASVEALKKGESVQLVGYLNLVPAERPARQAKNPRTGAVVNVPAKKVVKAKLGAKFAL